MSRIDKILLATTVVLALGVAIEFDRLRERAYPSQERSMQILRPRWLRLREPPIRRAVDIFYAFWAVMSVGVAVTILRRPQRLRTRLGRGYVAVVTSALAGWLLIAKELLWFALAWPPPQIPVALLFHVVHQVAGIVLGAWLALALAGHWRARRDWRDRLGRIIGWGWLGYFGYLFLTPVVWR